MELEKLKSIINEVLNVNPNDVTLDTSFVDDLGADSLDLFQIITGLEDEFDVEFDIEKANELKTVGDAVEEIKRLTDN